MPLLGTLSEGDALQMANGFLDVCSAGDTVTTSAWPYWITQSYTYGNQTAFTPALVSTATETFTSAADVVWGGWQEAPTFNYNRLSPTPRAFPNTTTQSPMVATLSARDELIQQNRIRARAMRSRVERRIGEQRAELLLMDNLTDEQRIEWAEKKQFHIDIGERRYRIWRGRAGNVELVRGHEMRSHYRPGRPRYCCHVVAGVPDADNVLAQKLLLESDEQRFLEMANVS